MGGEASEFSLIGMNLYFSVTVTTSYQSYISNEGAEWRGETQIVSEFCHHVSIQTHNNSITYASYCF